MGVLPGKIRVARVELSPGTGLETAFLWPILLPLISIALTFASGAGQRGLKGVEGAWGMPTYGHGQTEASLAG